VTAVVDREAPADAGGTSVVERVPPQDLVAEQSVLGGMLLSKDAIADVVEVLRPGDFYRPAHQLIYECVLDLYGRGEPADAVMVAAELVRRGELRRAGGAPYLHTVIATVPTAANAGYYAEIVAEKAVLRRLVAAGTRVVQLGYAGAGGAAVNEVVDQAQAEIYAVTERRSSEDYVALEELLQPTLDEIDAIASRGGMLLGVPTGLVDLDAVTNGLHPGQMITVAARPGCGKVDLGVGLGPVVFGAPRVDQRDLLLGDEPHRIGDAGVVGRVRDPAVGHARGPDGRGVLDAAGARDGAVGGGAAVHRRFAELDRDGDPREGAPAQAAPRSQVDRRRLPAADDLG
jgi:DnaB helicase-like protein